MPASGVIKLLDANVWLALAFSDHLHHAKAWFDGQPEGGCGFCRVTQMALLRHLTNSKIVGRFVQTQQDAWRQYDLLVSDPRVVFLDEPPAVHAAFRNFTQADSPSHGLWTDAYLAAFGVAGQVEVVTFDQAFSRFAGLDWLRL
jgi:toxin-antitoxin system PIN domain toxin